LKVMGSASFGTVDVLADGTGLSFRSGSALLVLTAQRLAWGAQEVGLTRLLFLSAGPIFRFWKICHCG
jgi:hypothetical protein